MHILTVCNDWAYFVRHRRFVVDHLRRRGHGVTIVVGGPRPAGARPSPDLIHTRIARFSFAPVLDSALALTLLRIVRRRRPATSHLITIKPVVVGGLASVLARHLFGSPRRIVLTLPGLGRMLAAPNAGGGVMRVSRRLTLKALRFLARQPEVFFTFETHADRDTLLREGLSPERMSVLPGAGVDPSVFFPAQGRVAQAREAGEKLRVLFASRLLKSKGLEVFRTCAARMRGQGIEFLVAGIEEPSAPDAIDPATLERDPDLVFLGEVTAMADLIRDVDLVCLPTRYGEGIPRILIEASACGIPSIATDLEGCREIVRDGETGRLLRSRDQAGLPAELEGVLREYRARPDLIARHGAAALRHFRRGGFSEDEVAEAFDRLLCAPGEL